MSVTSKFTHVHRFTQLSCRSGDIIIYRSRMHPTLCMALNLEAQEFPNQTPPKSRENGIVTMQRLCRFHRQSNIVRCRFVRCIERRGRESMRSQIGFNRGMRRRRATVIRPVHGKEGCWAVIVGSRRE
ncbi:unnamed protein product [Mycena citricolor]|uniref:Uncharacterized protein n=1 Tax=Mycena citricolor TaxID=2018698 RepID=A0AAD2Q2Z1_9AGAR|nr:unnamed protein product [Mycena citricolor]